MPGNLMELPKGGKMHHRLPQDRGKKGLSFGWVGKKKMAPPGDILGNKCF